LGFFRRHKEGSAAIITSAASSAANWRYGLYLDAIGGLTGSAAVKIGGAVSCETGIDLLGGSYSLTAIKLQNGQPIGWASSATPGTIASYIVYDGTKLNFGFAGSGTRAYIGSGLVVGSPTGGDKGSGTINVAGDIYKNNSAYNNPDYVFERYYGRVRVGSTETDRAGQYDGLLPLAEVEKCVASDLRLPGVGDAPLGLFERGDLLLEKIEEIYLYLFQHERQFRRLTAMNGVASGNIVDNEHQGTTRVSDAR
jgi:hypothetical protein